MATTQQAGDNDGPNKWKRAFGGCVVTKEYNEHLTSPGDTISKRSTLTAIVMNGSFGVSPTNIVRPSKIPDALKRAPVLQAILM
jgi:hypothetical protein